MTLRGLARAAVVTAALAGSVGAQQATVPSTADGEWPTYGGDLANSKYSPLDQNHCRELRVAADGLAREIARRFPEHDAARRHRVVRRFEADLRRAEPARSETAGATASRRSSQNFKATPLMVGGTLYREHGRLGRRRLRRAHRRVAVGLQPEELRSGHHDDDAAMEPARRRLLARRQRRARATGAPVTAILSPSTRRPAVPIDSFGVPRQGRPDGRPAAREARHARLSERARPTPCSRRRSSSRTW